ncbi:hypothetical protein TWF102_006833 [Orbilia oligospora]|uniref:Uncharacterized protein n=1 Tax=Orbilia oligospora TaxID=2813651 RepID=A0A7C8N3N0_ORBOL|nr:hypothetical protein TWF102_006833 [Orbilia oligospora]KAF3103666.1 hypothetical protein TWF103_007174 [Orbilia oligospora]
MASRPNLSQRKSTSSIVQLVKNNNEDGDVEPSTSAPKRPSKQFVVHSRHHRVPSGRNLKKLAGTRSHGDLVALAQAAAAQQAAQQAAAAANQGSKAHSTSPVPPWERLKEKEPRQSGGHELKKRSKSHPKRSLSTPNANSKKANFEFASAPGSFDDSADQLAQAELEDAMNQDAAKNAYMGGQSKPVTPTQADVPDISRRAQEDEIPSNLQADMPSAAEEKQLHASAADYRRTASSSQIKFTPAPAKPAPPATVTSALTNGNRIETIGGTDSAETTKLNTPATPQTMLTPKSETQKPPRPSPPFHTTNHPTAIPPQVSTITATITATTHNNEGRRSMSSVSSGPAPQPVTSRFISTSSSPSGALSSPSSVRETPMKKRNSLSFESPPTPHATPPSQTPLSTLNHDAILRKPGSTNIGAGKPLPNRTQTKLLLQRQSSQAEWEQEKQNQFQNGQLYYHSHSRRGSMNIEATPGGNAVAAPPMKLPREAIREVERINREYANVRRFGRKSLDRDGSGLGSLGLSQSLGANVDGRGAKSMVGVSGHGSRDDSGVVGRNSSGMDEAKIRELLVHVWNRDEPGGNNLSSSN